MNRHKQVSHSHVSLGVDETLEEPNSNPDSETHSLCNLGQVTEL